MKGTGVRIPASALRDGGAVPLPPLKQPEPCGFGGCFASGPGIELAQDRRDVMIDRLA